MNAILDIMEYYIQEYELHKNFM